MIKRFKRKKDCRDSWCFCWTDTAAENGQAFISSGGAGGMILCSALCCPCSCMKRSTHCSCHSGCGTSPSKASALKHTWAHAHGMTGTCPAQHQKPWGWFCSRRDAIPGGERAKPKSSCTWADLIQIKHGYHQFSMFWLVLLCNKYHFLKQGNTSFTFVLNHPREIMIVIGDKGRKEENRELPQGFL